MNKETSVAKAQVELKYVVPEVVSLKAHADYNEAWLEKVLREHPEQLGLGDVKFLDSQRRQKSGGRLDLLLEDEEDQKRYVCELMLGPLDEKHIVHALDYWLREKSAKGREEWEHIAVLIAEQVHGRFLNVVRHLSESTPLILMKMTTLKVGEEFLTLNFAPILDYSQETPEDEERPHVTTDRKYWLSRVPVGMLEIAENFYPMLKEIDPSISISYKQQFVGVVIKNKARNFVYFLPKKQFLKVHASLTDTQSWTIQLKTAGIEIAGVTEGKSLRFKITDNQQFEDNKKLLQQLCRISYDEGVG